jgi:hypothetical protein
VSRIVEDGVKRWKSGVRLRPNDPWDVFCYGDLYKEYVGLSNAERLRKATYFEMKAEEHRNRYDQLAKVASIIRADVALESGQPDPIESGKALEIDPELMKLAGDLSGEQMQDLLWKLRGWQRDVRRLIKASKPKAPKPQKKAKAEVFKPLTPRSILLN